MHATAFLRASRLRAGLKRHPWVYPNSIERWEGEHASGDAVRVRAPDGRFLAHALVNDDSRLALRLVSFDKNADLDDPAFWTARVEDAVRLRRETLGLDARTDAYRVIHSEGDGIPGLIVDRYGDVLVYTVSCLGTQRRLEPILAALRAAFSPQAIVEQGVSENLRRTEGLPDPRGVVEGELPAEQVVTIDGLRFTVPLAAGQKTGMFLDQRDNVQLAASLAKGRRVLDACCYLGAFSLACAQAGAQSVRAFDQSEEAVARARQHAEQNGVADRVEVVHNELFKELNALIAQEAQFDLIVLDPPKFAGSKKQATKAQRGYLDSNRLALKLLAPGGVLFSFSCSHHMPVDELEVLLRQAADRSKTDLRQLGTFGPGLDHPIDVHCPEGRYLKGLLFQRRG
ncbi:MAG: class I SAM-dependent rRNA methyltransferase [Planctomycetota bacterium]